MSLPLYQDHGTPSVLPKEGHIGLWWDKFFHFYEIDWKVDEEGKSRWLQTVSGKRNSGKNKKQLDLFIARQMELGHSLGAKQMVFETQWHFATGLGISHPVENGFSWHPTLGVPYLTGSAVKGLLRAWVEEWLFGDEQQELKKAKIRSWFGGEENEQTQEEAKAGDLIFFDALPIQPVEIGPDIMTPHLGKWYEQGASITNVDREPEKIPADWHSPIPIVFLVVKQAKFLFQIAPRGNTNPGEAVEAMNQLQSALEWLGAGAKTAVGYGRMSENEAELLRIRPSHSPTIPAIQGVEVEEIVTMIKAPQAGVVQVKTENGNLTHCIGFPIEMAQAKWDAEDTLFYALVTRREGVAISAVWINW